MRHGLSMNACRGGRLCPPQTFFFSFAPLAGCFLLTFVGAGLCPARRLSKKPVIACQSADWRGNLFPNRTILRFSANLQLKDCGFPRALRAAKQVPLGCALGMTEKKQGGRSVDGCRGGRPHAAAVCAYITGHRPLALPLGELSPQVTERAGMVMVCPLRPRCARPPLPAGEARDAHTAYQNVCRGGRFLAFRLSISRKCALHLGESVGIIVEKTDVCSYAGHTSVVT